MPQPDLSIRTDGERKDGFIEMRAMEMTLPAVLSVAGSDPSGGAGIQADLKTFLACGVYGMSVITAVVAENTTGVQSVYPVPGAVVRAQLESVCSDIYPCAVKIGMLSGAEQMQAVIETFRKYPVTHLVIDPVLAATDGTPLLETEAIDLFCSEMLPGTALLTPNIPEASLLTGIRIATETDRKEAAKMLVRMGAGAVLIKGGHLDGDAYDLYYDGISFTGFSAPRIETIHTHGTGCTLSAAITAHLAKGLEMRESIAAAKDYLTDAMLHTLAMGHGHGPLNHGFLIPGVLPADTPDLTERT